MCRYWITLHDDKKDDDSNLPLEENPLLTRFSQSLAGKISVTVASNTYGLFGCDSHLSIKLFRLSLVVESSSSFTWSFCLGWNLLQFPCETDLVKSKCFLHNCWPVGFHRSILWELAVYLASKAASATDASGYLRHSCGR